MSVSNYLNEKLLDHILREDISSTSFAQPTLRYMSLHDSNPTADGTASTEITGGGYVRQAINFNALTSGYVSNASAVNFTSLPPVPSGLTHMAFWDALEDGNLLFFEEINFDTASDAIINDGDQLNFPSASIQVRFLPTEE